MLHIRPWQKVILLALAQLLAAQLAIAGHQGQAPSWAPIGPAPPAIEAAVVADPRSRIVLIGGTGGGILRSTNDGASFSWSNSGLDSLTVISLLMDATSPNVVYAGTDKGIHKSLDAGATWHNIGGSIGAVILKMDPSDHHVIYAGSSPNGGVTKSIDGGSTWRSVNAGLGNPAVYGLAIDPQNTQVLYAGTAGTGAWKSIDGGEHWNPLSIDASVWAMLVDPDDSRVVYAGTNGAGMFRSDDGGGTRSEERRVGKEC